MSALARNTGPGWRWWLVNLIAPKDQIPERTLAVQEFVQHSAARFLSVRINQTPGGLTAINVYAQRDQSDQFISCAVQWAEKLSEKLQKGGYLR